MQHYECGVAFAEEGKHEEAILKFSKAIELDPEYIEAYYRGDTLCLCNGKYAMNI